jgi:hypothetical protein
MVSIEVGFYKLHEQFNSAHKTVRQYNWVVNEIKDASQPVSFEDIVVKAQAAFAIKPDNPDIPTKDQVFEGIKCLLDDGLIERVDAN